MKQYLELMRDIRENGVYKSDRTGTGIYSVFGRQMRFDLSTGKFPLVTTKKTHLKSIIHELLWFLKGETNVRYLKEHNVSIWDEWVKAETAEYRDMYPAEVQSALVKHLGVTDFTPVLSEELEGTTEYQLLRDEDDADRIVFEYGSEGSWLNAYEDIIDRPAQVLVAGELGPVYGSQWRSWPAPDGEIIDQISNLIHMLRANPDSRRLIVSAWNPAEVDNMALPPCHALFQFYTVDLTEYERRKIQLTMLDDGRLTRYWDQDKETFEEYMDEVNVPKRKLSCQLYQRSADVFLGVPFNIASYALLTMMVAQVVNMVPGEFVWTGGDVHLYSNHLEQADLQLTRTPHKLPTMRIKNRGQALDAFTYEDFELIDYVHDAAISAPIAV